MSKPAQVDGQRLRATVWKAIRRVYERDAVLLRDRVHERSILFHIGRHVAAAIDDWEDSWQVDLEYNRDYNRTLSTALASTFRRLRDAMKVRYSLT
jgi:hypothetical protein